MSSARKGFHYRRVVEDSVGGALLMDSACECMRINFRFPAGRSWLPNSAPRPRITSEHTDAEGIAALKSAGVQPVLLPGSVYALGSNRYPAARAMIDGGLAVVLATDFNPGSSPTPSMPMILSLASTHLR